MKQANTTIKRERHITPTIDDMVPSRLNMTTTSEHCSRDSETATSHLIKKSVSLTSPNSSSLDSSSVHIVQFSMQQVHKIQVKIKSLLGMTNCCSRFIKDFSICERKLTKKDSPWKWGPEQQAAL